MNRYLIISTKDPKYKATITKLTELSATKGINFSPRLSLDKTKALIQIKSEVKLPSNFQVAGVLKVNDKKVSGKSDKQWARDESVGTEWSPLEVLL